MIHINKRIGIIAANHSGYVDTVFSHMAEGNTVVPLKSTNDDHRIKTANVQEIITPEAGKQWSTPTLRALPDHIAALIAFTSGTTSDAKGVMLTHGNIANVTKRLNNVMQVDSDIREYIGVPVYHSFGLGRCRAVAAAGGQFFIPLLFRPAQIGEMLKKGEINAISAVPSLWRILIANKELIGSYGKQIKWIEIGSQYMSRMEKEAMKMLFPNAYIIQHYGLTEASRTTLLEIHQEEGETLESVGKPLEETKIKLTAERHIAIRGPHVAKNYMIDGKEVSTKDDEGWLVTQDLGKIDKGYLYYQGRADDMINYGGIKISPDILENKLYERLQCNSGLAVCRKLDRTRGEGFLVAITKETKIGKQELHGMLSEILKTFGVNASHAIRIAEVPSLPKTESGKIQRHKLVEYAKAS